MDSLDTAIEHWESSRSLLVPARRGRVRGARPGTSVSALVRRALGRDTGEGEQPARKPLPMPALRWPENATRPPAG